ncbi:PREDICTED: uncharacterized protein LOC108771949 [Cyphomyrmex costatus]|uniref:uncharacterized protein LOC108771949 n=1 Tax=Cyphomyrmex costatus TaxID=456900 RepID=UPI0008522D10|nr:PREDICTED: uncharacterized protein LOC108771949 [Cyphomyrmex costatus]
MNLVTFGLILICCHVWAIEIDDNFSAIWLNTRKTNFENFFEKLKSSLQNGTSGLEICGIPVSDPFIVNRLPLKYNLSTPVGDINIEGFLQNLNMSGLASYIVNSAKIKLIGMKANIDINWPSITVSNNYSLKGNALNYDVYGNGDIDGIVHNFKTIIDIGFKMIGRYIQVQTIATKIFLEGLDFNVTGIYNNEVISETISKTISNVMPKLIAANQKTIEYVINNSATQILNEYLSTITLMDIWKELNV